MAKAERQEIIDLSLEKLFNTIKDYESYPQFVNGMKSTRILETKSDGSKNVAFDIELIKRVQYTVNIQEKINDQKTEARIEWRLIESEALKTSHGLWILKSLTPTRTDVVYSLEVDFHFPVPGFVLKGLIATSMPLAIQEFKNRAAKG
jgi:ribosome-associated toxin RatA of RatAB toxin-antitoxin module